MSGIMINWDDSAIYYFMYKGYAKQAKNATEGKQYLIDIIEQYRNTKVTDFIMCVNARVASYPSKSIENYGDVFNMKEQNGQPVDFSDTWIASFDKVFNRWKIDHFALWIDLLRQMNIKPWVSIRMNDAHETLSQTSMLAPEYFYDNQDLLRVTHRKPYVTYDNLFDYSKKEVRDRMLSFIDETLLRYDVDGLELDWMREIYCFKPGHEYESIQIMNDFMKDVKKLVEKHEKIKNHSIDIAARIPTDADTAFKMGFDVLAWAHDGLVNHFSLCPRWSTTDTDIPMELWKSMLKPYNVTVAWGIEINMRPNRNYPITYHCLESVYASAATAFCAGADKFYLFNYMTVPDLHDAYSKDRQMINLFSNCDKILKNCGDEKSAVMQNRRHILTFQDLWPYWENTRYYVPRDMKPGRADPEIFRIRTGKVNSNQSVRIVMGIDTQHNSALCNEDITVWINSNRVSGLKKGEKDGYYTQSDIYYIEIVDISFVKDINIIEIFANKKEFTITHIEIVIEKDSVHD